MRKLILISVLSLFSALAFSQEAPSTESVTSSAVSAAPAASAESAARSFGSFIGRMVKAPGDIASSVVSGVRNGYADATTGSNSRHSESSDIATASSVSAGTSISASAVQATVSPITVHSSQEAASSTNSSTASAAIPKAPNVISFANDTLRAFHAQYVALAVGKQAPAPVEDVYLPSTSNLTASSSN